MLTGCGEEKYEPGPTWDINHVLEAQIEYSDFTIRVPEWSASGRFGSDYYLERSAEDGGEALLLVANDAEWADQFTLSTGTMGAESRAPLGSESTNPNNEVSASEDAMYAMMASRLDALLFQLEELRYIQGTYSTVLESKFRSYEGVTFEGEYTFSADEDGTNSVVYQGTGACFNSEAGAILVFALEKGEGNNLELLADTVEDICVSFRLKS